MWQKTFNSTKFWLFLVLSLATSLRFVNLGHPQAYIFDEVYHAFTAKEYLHGHIEAWEWWTTPPPGVAYEWTHPPVAKYGMVAGMWLFGETEFGYRSGSALFGVLSILGLYFFILRLTRNSSLALLTAFLVSIEGTHIAQSRLAMNDIYMLAFYVWSLFFALSKRWKWACILYGLALGSKWSSLYGSLPLAILYLHQNPPKQWDLQATAWHVLTSLRYLLIVLATYTLTFTPFILIGHDWSQWWELQRQMWYYHTGLVATHGYQSTPLQWIFLARPVWYWVEYGKDTLSNIYVQGNPAILWAGLVALTLQLPKILRSFPTFLLYTLYFVLFLPWVFSPRIMFYYHYLPSSVFLLPILASFLLTLPHKYRVMYLVIATLTLALLSPMLYGYALPTKYWDTLFSLFPTWK